MKPYSKLTKDERRLYHLRAWREYYYRTKPVRLAYSRKWQELNPEKYRISNNKATKKYKNKTRYSGLRYFILERDNHKCVNCGSTYSLMIHHRNGISWVNSTEPDNKPENLITLCLSCHTTLHHQLKGHKVSKTVSV